VLQVGGVANVTLHPAQEQPGPATLLAGMVGLMTHSFAAFSLPTDSIPERWCECCLHISGTDLQS
jgi:hypothetical protein